VSHLRGKFARFIALVALLAGLIGAATPGVAATAPAAPTSMHAAMDCDHAGRRPAPMPHHGPGATDCCIANVCAMSLALPATAAGIVLPLLPVMPGYDLRALLQPIGIVTAPIPHPPKSIA
jgi:hypothetical protein